MDTRVEFKHALHLEFPESAGLGGVPDSFQLRQHDGFLLHLIINMGKEEEISTDKYDSSSPAGYISFEDFQKQQEK